MKEERWTKDELFNFTIAKSKCFTFSLRLGCFALMVFSFLFFFYPITTLLTYLPFIGRLVSGIAFVALLLASLIICVPVFLFTLSIAWLRFHQKIGFILLALGIISLIIILVLNYTRRTANGAGPTHLLSLREMGM